MRGEGRGGLDFDVVVAAGFPVEVDFDAGFDVGVVGVEVERVAVDLTGIEVVLNGATVHNGLAAVFAEKGESPAGGGGGGGERGVGG